MDFLSGQANEFITKIGFPICLSVYLIWRIEKRLERIMEVMVVMAERLKVDPFNNQGDR